MTLNYEPSERLAGLVEAYRRRFGSEPIWLPVWLYCRRRDADPEELLAELIRASIWSGRQIRVPVARSNQEPEGMPWAMIQRRPITWRPTISTSVRTTVGPSIK